MENNKHRTIPHYIFPGRFQPFHNDHLRVVDTFMNLNPDAILILAVVRNFIDEKIRDDFDKISEEHFLPERNPFDSIQVLSMISALARHRFPKRIVTTLIPQPSSGTAWKLIRAMFPGKRIWLIQKREEKWDENKANFFSRMGDEVLKIPCPRSTNGKTIREYLAAGNISAVKALVPPEVLNVIEEEI